MRRTRNLIVTVAALGVLGGSALVVKGFLNDGTGGTDGGALAGSFQNVPTASPTPTGPSPEELAAIERAKRVKALDAAMKKYASGKPEFSVAVLDHKSGESYAYRGEEKYETASVVKVQVLACLLLTAQDAGRSLTGGERTLADKMIRYSDNASTTSLFGKIGKYNGLTACNKRLGLTETKVSSSWGLTRTTVNDQLKLLTELADEKSELTEASREYAHKLMGTVAPDQDWGVTAVADTGEKATVKNGWLQRSTESNLWIINTVGRVTDDDTDVSIAVLSHTNKTMPGGISLVEKAAELTRAHLKY
ncbi:serine hydrolase [Actinoplanes sp. NEAU-A12]|uniref:Serine hydrolase n=1 Tax=Actinoplanes sandaracinus TaxID=3045177 RepID=A0ABT6WNC6_9ACTN|nr:serine hydrolase [Actinoplanes sandaracinus]MDI6101219.1 serine hydrolase [Actinoplanes sandaracinus]